LIIGGSWRLEDSSLAWVKGSEFRVWVEVRTRDREFRVEGREIKG